MIRESTMLTVEAMNHWGSVWFEIIGHTAWQAAIIGLLAVLIVRRFSRIPAYVRYGLLLIALFKFVTPPITDVSFGLFSQLEIGGQPVVTDDVGHAKTQSVDTHESAGPGVSIASAEFTEHATTSDSTAAEFADHVNMRAVIADAKANSESLNVNTSQNSVQQVAIERQHAFASVSATSSSPAVPALSFAACAMVLHIFGAAAVLLFVAGQTIRLRRRIRQFTHLSNGYPADEAIAIARQLGMRLMPRVVLSPDAHVPYSFGLFQRVVVLPATLVKELDRIHLRAVLFHELSHHRRMDLWLNTLQVVIASLWWFHPVIWFLNKQLRSTREDCCDDYVLSKEGVSDTTYCEAIVRVAAFSSRSVPTIVVTMADNRHPLAERLERVMDSGIRRRSNVGVLGAISVLLAACLLLPGIRPASAVTVNQNAVAKDEESADDAKIIHGIVRDSEKNPVQDADVFLFIEDRFSGETRDSKPIAQLKTSQDGTFRFSLTHEQLKSRLLNQLTETQLFVMRDGMMVGFAEFRRGLPGHQIEIELAESVTSDVRIQNPDGGAATGATVRIEAYRSGNDSYIQVPLILQQKLSSVTNDQGIARFHGLARDSIISIRVESKLHGTQSVSQYGDGKFVEAIKLRSTGTIVGEVSFPKADVDASVVSLRCVTSSPDNVRGQQRAYGIVDLKPSADGKFQVPQIATGDLKIIARVPADLPFRATPTTQLFVAAGGVTKLRIEFQDAVKFSRYILEKDSKEPVAGAYASIGSGWQPQIVRSDKTGKIQAWLLPDRNYHTVYDLPAGFMARNLSAYYQTRVSEDQSDPLSDILVLRAKTIRGTVVDGNGKPQSNVQAAVNWNDKDEDFGESAANAAVSARVWGRTDDDGKFEIRSVHPTSSLLITPVRNGLRLADSRKFSADAPEPFKLTVKSFQLTSLAGKVVDSKGAAVVDVACWVYANADGKLSGRYGSLAHRVKTNADGMFKTPADLPKSFSYRIYVRSDNREIGNSKWFRPVNIEGDMTPVIIVDSDKISPPAKSASSTASVECLVTDTSGKPVADAQLIAWYTARRRQMTTNAAGKVILDSVPSTGFWVFVKADGFHFHGQFAATPQKQMTVALLRIGEPKPKAIGTSLEDWGKKSPKDPHPVSEAVLQLARKNMREFAETVFSTFNDEDSNTAHSPPYNKKDVHRTLAAIDPDVALKYIGDKRIDLSDIRFSNSKQTYQEWHENAIRSIANEAKLEADGVDVDALLKKSVPASQYLQAARRLPDNRTADRLRLLNKWVEKFDRSVKSTKQAENLTFVANEFLQADDPDTAKKLFNDVLKMIRTLPASERLGFTKGYFAWQYAAVDHKKSLELITAEQDQRARNRYLSNIAMRIAAIDPAESERVLLMLPMPSRIRPAARVAVAMASSDAERALKIADTISDRLQRAYVRGLMAGTFPDSRSAEAKRMLESAFELLDEHVRSGIRSSGNQSPIMIAVALLPTAKKVAPVRFAEYFWRALSYRQNVTHGNTSSLLGPYGHNDHLRTADAVLGAFLSRYNPHVGELLTMPASDETLEDGFAEAPYFLLGATAIFDPEAAVRAATALPDETNRQQHNKHAAWRQVLAMLRRSPAERWDWLMEHQYFLWQPGEVD